VVAALKKIRVPKSALAGRMFCGRIPLAGWHRPARTAPDDDQHALGRRHRRQQLRHA
jgi:hypothetical protein